MLKILIPPFVEFFFWHDHRPFPIHRTESEKTWTSVSCMFDNALTTGPIVSQTCFSRKIWEEVSTCRRFPSAFMVKSLPARRSLLSCDRVNSWLLKCSRNNDYPGCNLISIPLMGIDLTCGQNNRLVSSPERLLGALLKLSTTKVCQKRCGRHLIHRVGWFAINWTMIAIGSWWRSQC